MAIVNWFIQVYKDAKKLEALEALSGDINNEFYKHKTI